MRLLEQEACGTHDSPSVSSEPVDTQYLAFWGWYFVTFLLLDDEAAGPVAASVVSGHAQRICNDGLVEGSRRLDAWHG